MHAIQTITIPDPCHQQWQQMTTVGNGRYCDHCCKTVVDFSVMSNEEIITHLSANNNVCGRFEKKQLAALHNQTPGKNTWRYFRRAMLVAASMIGVTPIAGAKSNKVLLLPADSLHTKQKVKHAGTAQVRVLNKKAVNNKGFQASGKARVNNGAVKVIRYPYLPYNDAMLGKVVYNAVDTSQVKQIQIIRSADNVSHVMGGVIKGVMIKQEEKEVDRELLYELGVR